MKAIKIKTIGLAMALSILCSIFSIFYFAQEESVLAGIFIGTVVSIINFFILISGMTKLSTMTQEKARGYSMASYSIRYVLYGASLFLSVLYDGIHLVGTIMGIISFQIAIQITLAIEKRAAKSKK